MSGQVPLLQHLGSLWRTLGARHHLVRGVGLSLVPHKLIGQQKKSSASLTHDVWFLVVLAVLDYLVRLELLGRVEGVTALFTFVLPDPVMDLFDVNLDAAWVAEQLAAQVAPVLVLLLVHRLDVRLDLGLVQGQEFALLRMRALEQGETFRFDFVFAQAMRGQVVYLFAPPITQIAPDGVPIVQVTSVLSHLLSTNDVLVANATYELSFAARPLKGYLSLNCCDAMPTKTERKKTEMPCFQLLPLLFLKFFFFKL